MCDGIRSKYHGRISGIISSWEDRGGFLSWNLETPVLCVCTGWEVGKKSKYVFINLLSYCKFLGSNTGSKQIRRGMEIRELTDWKVEKQESLEEEC